MLVCYKKLDILCLNSINYESEKDRHPNRTVEIGHPELFTFSPKVSSVVAS